MEDYSVEIGSDNVKDIKSAEELEKLLSGEDTIDVDDEGNPIEPAPGKGKEGTPPAKKEDDEDEDELPKPGQKPKVQPDKGKEGDEDDDNKNKDEDDEVYSNVIHYLDKTHNLGLNLAELPKDLSREQEGELVSELFQKVVANANDQLRQYEQIAELLQDDEVAALLQAKSEGKGLKDLYAQFAVTPDGLSDDQLVYDDLKKKYPKLPEATINTMIANQKEKGQFAEIATAIREQRKEEDAKSATQREADEAKAEAERQQAYEQEVQQFTGLVQKVNKINGVAFTNDMKAEVLNFALKRNAEGLTQLDEALQSDVGLLRASLGVILLEKLMEAQTSASKNQGRKSVFEKLMTKPPEGSGTSQRTDEEVPDELFNQW